MLGASPPQLCPQAPSKEGAMKGRPRAREKPARARPSPDVHAAICPRPGEPTGEPPLQARLSKESARRP